MNAEEKIEKAFKELMVQKPIDKITITELTAKAHVNRKTFYNYFYSMKDVLISIEEKLLNDLDTAIDALDPFTVESFMKKLAILTQKNKAFYSSLIENRQNPSFLNDAQSILKEGLKNKLFPGSNDPYDNFKLEFVGGGIIQLYISWLKDSHGITLNQLSKIVNLTMNKF